MVFIFWEEGNSNCDKCNKEGNAVCCESVEPIVPNSLNWEKKAGSRLKRQIYFPEKMTS